MAETVEAVLASRSFYDALGVARDAPADQIRRAYILRSRLVHPDKCAHPEAKAAFQRVSDAYRTLVDPNLKKRYDLAGETISNGQAPDETLLDTLFTEFMQGQFDALVRLGLASQIAMRGNVFLDEPALRSLFGELHRSILAAQRYRGLVSGDVGKLLTLQAEWLAISALDVTGRLRKTIAIAQQLILLLTRVDDAEVALLSGRMQPVRDALVTVLARIDSGVVSAQVIKNAVVGRLGTVLVLASPIGWAQSIVTFVIVVLLATFDLARKSTQRMFGAG